MRLLLGIGNPGPQYAHTRHNLGFMVVDALAETHRIAMRKRRYHSMCGEGLIAGQPVMLIKPQTFVNASGLAVRAALRDLELDPSSLLVICDDYNLPVGALRIRRGGRAGGHHGLESIIEKLQSSDFPRIRLGIGDPDSDGGAIDHVLSIFSDDELPVIGDVLDRATEAVTCILTKGIEAAMNRFNRTQRPRS